MAVKSKENALKLKYYEYILKKIWIFCTKLTEEFEDCGEWLVLDIGKWVLGIGKWNGNEFK